MTALAMDVRELTWNEVDEVNGAISWKEIGIAVGIGVAANLLTPVVVGVAAVAGVAIVGGVAINLVVGVSPAY